MKWWRPLLYIGLLVVGAALLLVSRFQLPVLQLDLVWVPRGAPEREEGIAASLDDILLAYAPYLRRSQVIRHGLGQPYQVHQVKGFHANRCEVTRGDFSKFEQWQGVYPQRVKRAPGQSQPARSNNRTHRVLGRLDSPVSGVSHHDAHAYCASAGGALPNHEQHLAMVHGTGTLDEPAQRLYPWGDAPVDEAWPYMDPVLNAAQQCAAHPQTASPEGLHGLGHGMLEWLRSQSDASIHAEAAGAYPQEAPHALYSLNLVERQLLKSQRSNFVGFRCVWEQPPKTLPWGSEVQTTQIEGGWVASGVRDSGVADLVSATAMSNWSQTERQLARYRQLQTPTAPLEPIGVSRCEVTREQYRLFLLDPLVDLGFYAHEQQPPEHRYEPLQWQAQLQQPQLPVHGVDWWSAHAYARWLGGRLPSAEEWQDIGASYALRAYPWGNEYSSGSAITGDTRRVELQACGSAERDFTDDGVADMAGNLSEWTASARETSRGIRVQVKGGNYFLPGDKTSRLSHSLLVTPEYRSATLGLRVILDP